MQGGGDAEGMAIKDLRRQKKNIDVYLSKVHSIDTTMTKPAERSKCVSAEGAHTLIGPHPGPWDPTPPRAASADGGAALWWTIKLW